jgi:hypothetical protein
MCKGLNNDCDHDYVSHLSGYTRRIFDRSFLGFFLTEVSQNSSPNSLVAHNHQNQCYEPAWGSCASCHCSGGAGGGLGLCQSLKSSSVAQACESVVPLTC